MLSNIQHKGLLERDAHQQDIILKTITGIRLCPGQNGFIQSLTGKLSMGIQGVGPFNELYHFLPVPGTRRKNG
ncbi:hypothetical protein A7E78_05785 [Syntrophotalea acetylenivorans]|uniref:Uncharacterized protein n=1 Tax=Syntrophotalea acetylenivorans TaxID=1842532 RepID=A0A1L3GN89_9BACT|nr:hypothetical protein [Syntrophotalea acetylenivorans]APG27394.1 hypothetical protein A7E78_05785 [Syntrophotalea acetylenivorans]